MSVLKSRKITMIKETAGFSLVEIRIAIVLFTIGIIAIIYLFPA